MSSQLSEPVRNIDAGVSGTSAEPDASATVKGILKLSTAPASSTNPIAAGTNDSRMTNARTPSAHAASHQNSGADEVATATAAANAIPKAGGGGTLAIGWIPVGTTSSTVAAGNDARFATIATIQTGVSILSSGTVTVNTANITASSRIFISYKTLGGSPVGGASQLMAKSADRSNGTPGSFKIYSIGVDGSTVTTDASTVDWLIVG